MTFDMKRAPSKSWSEQYRTGGELGRLSPRICRLRLCNPNGAPLGRTRNDRMAEPKTILAESTTDHWAAVMAGFFGWTLDAFDFFLVILCVPAIAASFHVAEKEIFFTVAMTLAMRPVGAFIFGLLADRYGRRRPLMLNVVFYSSLSILSGLAPNFTTFLIFRILFGIGMGGEWGVGASLAMEKVPPRLRGILSGLLQEGYAVGNLMASGAYFFIFPHSGWRPLFWLGGIPALLALFIRMHVKESEIWQRSKHHTWSHLGSAILKHWRLFLSLTLLMWMMNLASHGTQDMFPTFLQNEWHMGPHAKAIINAISMVGAIIGGIVVGLLSDRIGRRRAMILSFILAILLIPLWAYAPNVGLLALGAFLIQFMVQGAWGVIPAHITELSPDSVRGFLPGFAYQCGVLLAGSIAYVQALLKSHITYGDAMALTAVIVFIAAAIVIGLGSERRGITFGESSE
jgi:SHS family lactate transporter-like MFS transporter